MKKYRVLFHGLQESESTFKSRMADLGASPGKVDLMISRAPVVLKADLPLKTAALYAKAVQDAGGIIKIEAQDQNHEQENPEPIQVSSFQDFTMCPECGFKQKKSETCVKCGLNPLNDQ